MGAIASPSLPVQNSLVMRESLQDQFEQFHAENPGVYRKLVQIARSAKSSGKSQYGIGSCWERLRWHLDIETNSSDEFSLNNNHRSRYARLIMEQEPDLKGFFHTRELKSN